LRIFFASFAVRLLNFRGVQKAERYVTGSQRCSRRESQVQIKRRNLAYFIESVISESDC
jgi:hypothetical protein